MKVSVVFFLFCLLGLAKEGVNVSTRSGARVANGAVALAEWCMPPVASAPPAANAGLPHLVGPRPPLPA